MLLIGISAQAQDWTVRFYDESAEASIISRTFERTFAESDLMIVKTINVFKSYMTGLGRQNAIYGRKIILKVRDYYQSKLFEINGQRVYWNQIQGISVKFLEDEGNFDVIEIFIPTNSQKMSITFLEDYRSFTPNIGNPEGYTANKYRVDLLFN